MNRVFLAILSLVLFAGAAFSQTATDLNEGTKISIDSSSGAYTFSWWGRSGRTYFIEFTDDLVATPWTYAPIIESGSDQIISWGFTSSSDKFFVRLKYTDFLTSDPSNADFDSDGVSNLDELLQGTDPLKSLDLNNNGLPDDWELFHANSFAAWPSPIKMVLSQQQSGTSNLILNNSTAQPVQYGVAFTDNLACGFNYSYADSKTGGINFAWEDIRSTGGTELSGDISADDGSQAIKLNGFTFPFYGKYFSTVHVCSNGFLTFGNGSTDYSNMALPNPEAPGNMVAVFWDDLTLYPTEGGSVYYKEASDTLTIQYQDVPALGGYGKYTFQVVLSRDGTIEFRYKDLSGNLSSCTVGIQDAEGAEGIPIACNQSYLENSMAIRISPFSTFVGAVQLSGTVAAGAQEQLGVTFDAMRLSPGNYTANIQITPSSGTGTITVPATLQVINLPSQVSIISPKNGYSQVESQAFNITATATDADTTIVRVEFYDGATKIGECNQSDSDQYTLSVNELSVGSHTITAKAIDNLGQGATSQPIVVTSSQDTDSDGLPDAWEMQYFGNLDQGANDDFDGDGMTNLEEYRQGSDPTDYYSQGSRTIVPQITILSGNNQSCAPGAFSPSPLLVSIVDTVTGTPLPNAPVTFTVNGGEPRLSSTATLNAQCSGSLALRTDSEGKVSNAQSAIYYLLPATIGTVGQVTVTSGSATPVTFSFTVKPPTVDVTAKDSSTFRFSRKYASAASGTSIIVGYSVSGDAVPNVDYVALSGTAAIPSGADYTDVNLTSLVISGTFTTKSVTVTTGTNSTYLIGNPSATLFVLGHDTPTSTGASVITGINTPITIPLTASGTNLTYSLYSSASHGNVTANSGSACAVYTPATNYSGTDSFAYRAWDGVSYSDPITISIFVALDDSDGDGMSDSWEMQHFGTLDMGAYDDADGDGYPNIVEYLANADPSDAASTPTANFVVSKSGAPGTYASIQAAINDVSGDFQIIEVQPGTYMENLTIAAHKVLLISSSGAATTAINGDATGTVISASTDSIINGFTIMNGAALQSGTLGNGGGIHVTAGDSEFVNCVIRGNQGIHGAAIYSDGGCADFLHCSIINNSTSGDAIYATGSNNLSFTNSMIWNPSASMQISGSCIAARYSDVLGGYVGIGNLNADPQVTVDGHISASSPCIGMASATFFIRFDMDKQVRDSMPDIGADEYVGGVPSTLDQWKQQYFGTTNVDMTADPDRDGLTNLQEFQLGTNPTILDTDGDGVSDGVEVAQGRNPLKGADPDSAGTVNLQVFTPLKH